MTKSSSIKISFLLLAGVALLYLALMTSCKCRACEDEEEGTVPLEVLNKADSFIVASTGRDFFDKYITADFIRTRHTPPYYELTYRFYMPDKPYVSAAIKFTVDSSGNVMNNRDIVGIPRCKNFPEECEFNIDEQTARQIASQYGLKDGIKEWDAAFMWDFKLQRYVWRILSTTREFSLEDVYRAAGQEMIIDPNTGDVLALNDWIIN